MTGILNILSAVKTGIAAAVDEFFNRTTLLLSGDGTNGAQNNTFLDSSSNNFTITRNGNTTQGTFSPFSQTGWSNRLVEANNDYLTTNSSASFGISGDFTYEGWVYLTSTAFKRFIMPSSVSMNVDISQDSGNNMKLGFFDGTTAFTDSVNTFPINTWAHVAVVRSGSGTNNCSFYVNGVRGTQFTTNATNSTVSITIGKYSTNGFDGYISNLRFCKSAVYSGSTYTVPTSPLTTTSQGATNCVLLTCQSNRFVDNSSTAATLTPTGTPSVQAFSPFAPSAAYSAATNGASGYFDGTGDYLSATFSSRALFNGNATFEAWVYFNSVSGQQVLFRENTSGTGFNFGSNGTALQIDDTSNAGSVFATSSGVISANQWLYIAVTRSSNTFTIYVNGTSVGTNSSVYTYFTSNATGFLIGTLSSSNYLNGYMCNARISNTARTISLPTSLLTSDGNTVALLNYTNAGITDATAKNDLETVGNAQISTTQSKFGGSSIYFDGTGDYLSLAASQNYSLGTGDFTVEMWVYNTNRPGGVNYPLWDARNPSSGTSTTGAFFGLTDTNAYPFLYCNGTVATGSSAPALNTWAHIAFVRNSGTLTIYLNGTSVASASFTANLTDAGTYVTRIGQSNAGSTENYTGYIDDMRITKGYARYTANFSVPTAAFALQ